MPWKVHNFIFFTFLAVLEGKLNTNPFFSSLPCFIWSILTNTANDQAISALPSQVAHSVCSKEHRHNQAFGWMHNSHWIGQIFGFKYRSAATNWNIAKRSLWELNVHKRRTEGKRKKEVLKGWARAAKTRGAISLFHTKVGGWARKLSESSTDGLLSRLRGTAWSSCFVWFLSGIHNLLQMHHETFW